MKVRMKELIRKFAVAISVIASGMAMADVSPYATGGEVRRIVLDDLHEAYVHVFTNTSESATFVGSGRMPLSVRYLIVGAGGCGGKVEQNNGYGGGGGGGGGVLETNDVAFAADASWTITVGKGAANLDFTAGASSICNDKSENWTVPGGGNGSAGLSRMATEGAAGGGGAGNNGDYRPAASGNYRSSIFGEVPDGAPFKGGDGKIYGGGGGGAGQAGDDAIGGEGLVSDISGQSLVYGSGGGGGGCLIAAYKRLGGIGGSRAGDGATWTEKDNGDGTATTNLCDVTIPEANSGAGGGGGMRSSNAIAGKSNNQYGTGSGGADGIVIIRYEVTTAPCAGGDRIEKISYADKPWKTSYVHTFTNVNEAQTLRNMSGKALSIRYLAVGAGGCGGSYKQNNGFGCGGGGGGGVMETNGVAFVADASWAVTIGKGAAGLDSTAGASSICNDKGETWIVPGGGNGSAGLYLKATEGAAGGGGAGGDSTYRPAADGNYRSSIFGKVPDGAPFKGGNGIIYGGGGGGAGTAGNKATGGEGLVSDISGQSLVYGSGGGGGGCLLGSNKAFGGIGGLRAGNGATWTITDNGDGTAMTNLCDVTIPVANSGAGGGGGMRSTKTIAGMKDNQYGVGSGGADGVVIVRYDIIDESRRPGLVILLK